MDLDVLLITDENPTVAFIQQLHGLFERIQNISTTCLDVQYALKDGPMKPPAHDRPVVFLHVLLHSVRSYRESPLTLVKRSWQSDARPFLGACPGHLERLKPVSRDELLLAAIGILDCLDLLQRLRTPYLEWVTRRGSDQPMMCVKAQDVTDDLAVIETALYCTLRCASNACRWLLGRSAGIGIQTSTIDTFEDLFGTAGWASAPREAYIAKRLVRKGEICVSPQLAASWQSRALSFLEGLRACIESMPAEINGPAALQSSAHDCSVAATASC